MKLKDINPKYYKMLEEKPAKDNETDFKFVVPSGQFWQSLTPEEKAEVYNIANVENVSMDNLLYEMRQMLPRTPKGH